MLGLGFREGVGMGVNAGSWRRGWCFGWERKWLRVSGVVVVRRVRRLDGSMG